MKKNTELYQIGLFITQILLFNRTTKHLNFAVSYFNVYGISSDPKSGNLIMQERSDF